MVRNIIIALVVLMSLVIIVLMIRYYLIDQSQRTASISKIKKLKLAVTGVLAFIADPIGIGSFAVMIAFCKFWKLVDDTYLPGTINGAQILPGAIESIMFLQVIHVDYLTLIVLVVGTCIGGLIGGMVVSKLNQKHIEITMAFAFVILAILILLDQLHLLPLGGGTTYLRGWKLWIGFFGTIVCGFLPALGVGLFALIEVLLFLLGMSPLIAFPIMTTAGALQQTLTTLPFVLNKRMCLKEITIIALVGVVAVVITVPFVSELSFTKLRWLLLAIVIYNAFGMFRSYFKNAH